MLSTVDEFANALRTYAPRYNVELSAEAEAGLRKYYEHLSEWNARLHLVAPCPPEEFATRHVLESLLALPHLADNSTVADIGSGAGLPIIPCLIMRSSVRATLIEASAKKSVFLGEALRILQLRERARVVNERFERMSITEADFITCRALDRFREMFPKLLAFAPAASTLLLFGGPTLQNEIERQHLSFNVVRAPDTERRFLFIVRRAVL